MLALACSDLLDHLSKTWRQNFTFVHFFLWLKTPCFFFYHMFLGRDISHYDSWSLDVLRCIIKTGVTRSGDEILAVMDYTEQESRLWRWMFQRRSMSAWRLRKSFKKLQRSSHPPLQRLVVPLISAQVVFKMKWTLLLVCRGFRRHMFAPPRR